MNSKLLLSTPLILLYLFLFVLTFSAQAQVSPRFGNMFLLCDLTDAQIPNVREALENIMPLPDKEGFYPARPLIEGDSYALMWQYYDPLHHQPPINGRLDLWCADAKIALLPAGQGTIWRATMGRGPNATVVTLTQGMSLTAEMLHSYRDVKPGTFNYIPDDKATKLHIEFLGGAITNKNDFQIRFSGKVPVKSPFNIFTSADTELSNTIKNSATFFNDLPKLGKAAAPTSLTATPGNVKATISFTAGSANGGTISNYEYQLDGGSWVALAPEDATSPITIMGLINGTTYSIKLRAITGAGAGTESAAVSVTPRPDPPAAPTIGTITSGNQQLSVAFTAGDNGGAAITNYSYSTNGTTYTAFSPAQTTSPLIITGLTNGTPYNITIKAINSQGSGEASSSASGTPYTVPGAPTITSATPGNASAEIAFTAPGSNGGNAISTYEYQLGSGSWVSANTTSSPFTISSLTNGQEYKVKLRAKNAAGTSVASNEVSVTPRTVPGAPTGVTGVQDDLEAAVMVSWTAPASNGGSPITQYTVDSSPGFNGCTSDSTPPATSCKVGGLTRGTAYTFTVTAWNEAGFGAASSASQSFTIPVKIPQTITFGAISQKTWGDADFDLGPATTDQGQTVTFTAADPTIVEITGNKAKLLKVGSTKITASQAGSALYFPATSVERTLTVIKASQTITFAALADKTYEDPDYELGPSETDKKQTITYTSSDPTIVSITGNKATLLKGGSVTITASQAGDAFYEPATPIQRTLKVNKAAQTIAFTALADRTYGDPPITFTPTQSNKSLPVVYTSSMPNVVSITGATGTILRGGPVLQNGDIEPVIITASQAGDERYLPAEVSWPLTVYRAPQSVSLNYIPTRTYGDPNFTMSPVLSSVGLPVSYSTSDPAVISLDGNTGIINKSGNVVISVDQAGDERYLPAPTYKGYISVRPAKLNLSPLAGQGKDYGSTDPVIGFEATGFVNDQDRSILAGGLGRKEGELPGTYAVTLGNLGFKEGFQERYEVILAEASFEIRIVDTDKDLVPDHIEDQEGSDKLDPESYRDTDGDKVPNYYETVIDKTNPDKPLEYKDTDGDLVPDYIELRKGTDLNDKTKFPDTDKGGTPDYVEQVYFPNAGLKPTNPDLPGDDRRDGDGDEVSDYRELMDKTKTDDPNSFKDSDGDGVPDEVEERDGTDPSDKTKYRDTDGDLVPDYVEVRENGDPKNSLSFADADGDLVPDYIEKRDGTDLADKTKYLDSDKGGTPDYVEVVYFPNKGLNPGDPADAGDDGRDADGDEVTDYREMVDGTDISDLNSFKDSDGDGVPDQVEERDGTDPADPIDYRDSDGDLVPDYVERRSGTSSRNALSFLDSDGDLVPDYIEKRDGTDPNNADLFKDTDKGGTPDYVEQTYYRNAGLAPSDITKASDDGRDSDGDGKGDYLELKSGTNPKDDEDFGFKKGTGSCFNPYDPYIVETLYHLNSVRLEPDKCYLQAKHIDARPTQQWNQGRGFVPIGSDGAAFTGWYDGAYYRITGLFIDVPGVASNQPDNVVGAALFGKVLGTQERAAQISRVQIDSISVSGQFNVSALVGYGEWANLSEVSSRGEIQASGERAGGLLGHGRHVSIEKSYSQATIAGSAEWKGGLAGTLRRSRVSDSYFAGRMSASQRSAGLVAYLEQSTLTNTYAAMLGTTVGQNSTNSVMSGTVVESVAGSKAENTYWEVTESNVSRGSLGSGGTTVQMMDANRYSGWDFSGTWAIASGDSISYPYLRAIQPKLLPGHRPSSYLQVIHNMATGPVAVQIDGITRVNSLTPEGATPYMSLPSGAAFEVKLVSVATGKTKASYVSTPLKPAEAYLIYATGGEDDSQGELITLEDTKREAETPDKVDIIFVNGANAYPRLDLDYITNNTPASVQKNIGKGIPFGEKSEYSSLNFSPIKSFRLSSGGATLGEFNFSMEGLKGQAFKIVALGNAAAKQANGISLVAVTPEGKVINARIGTSLDKGEVPTGFSLHANYPNPFNPSTTIRFDLPETARVSVQVVDVMGRLVLQTQAQSIQAGAQRSLSIDASGLSSGVYLYRLTAESATATYTGTGRFTLLK